MKIPIESASSIGEVVRASRKAQRIRQDDAAGSIGVSENFLGKVESGSDSVNWGKLFSVLAGLGIKVELDVPKNVVPLLRGELKDRLSALIAERTTKEIASGSTRQNTATKSREEPREDSTKASPKDTSNE